MANASDQVSDSDGLTSRASAFPALGARVVSVFGSPVEAVLAVSLFLSLSLLAGAHIFEALGYAPCALCLDQREAHWAAAAVSGAGLIASGVFKARLAAAAAVGATGLVYALSAGLAFFHTGVEFGFWPPLGCDATTVPDSMDVSDLSSALAPDAHFVSCTDAQWRLFGVSMAGYNFLASALLFAACAYAASISNKTLRTTGGEA